MAEHRRKKRLEGRKKVKVRKGRVGYEEVKPSSRRVGSGTSNATRNSSRKIRAKRGGSSNKSSVRETPGGSPRREFMPKAKSPESSLMEEVMDTIIELLEEGNSESTASDYVGISPSTYRTWLSKGRAYEEQVGDGDQNPEHEKYYMFLRAVRKATARYRRANVLELNNAGAGIWVKYLTILERKDRKGWGRQEEEADTDSMYSPDDVYL